MLFLFVRFRHPNIIDLLGFSEGPGTVCLIYNYMENKSLEHKLHNVTHTHTHTGIDVYVSEYMHCRWL